MDADFDLYGDADIYGEGNKDDVKKDEEGDEVDYLAEANDNGAGASHGSTSTGNKRSREESGADEPMSENKDMRYSSPAPSKTEGHGSAMQQQSAMQQPRSEYNNSGSSRMVEDTAAASDPSAARIALAGRPKVTDPSVQNALYIGELDWWVSDEEIRKVAQDIGIPLLLSDVTFSEHKVNGKSKGVAYVEMGSEEEAKKLKSWYENNDVNYKRAIVNLTTSANGNPFRTLPKDPPPREGRPARGGMRGGAREGGGGGGGRGGRGDGGVGTGANIPMAGAPIRMGGSNSSGAAGMPMMNPMMMGMMGGGRPPFGGQGNPMSFMGGNNYGGQGSNGGSGGGMGRGGYGRGRPPMNPGMGHFNPNFFGGMQGQGSGGGGGGAGRGNGGGRGGEEDRDRDRKRYRTEDNY